MNEPGGGKPDSEQRLSPLDAGTGSPENFYHLWALPMQKAISYFFQERRGITHPLVGAADVKLHLA